MFSIKFEKLNQANKFLDLLADLDNWIGLEDCKIDTSGEESSLIEIEPITPIHAICKISDKYGEFDYLPEERKYILTIEDN